MLAHSLERSDRRFWTKGIEDEEISDRSDRAGGFHRIGLGSRSGGSALCQGSGAGGLTAPSWTGFYIFGGAGGGIWDANGGVDSTATGACIVCTNTRTGGDGWFGTVGAGYDWQIRPRPGCVGIFGDGTFGNLKGNIGDAGVFAGGASTGIVGSVKMETAWAAGARVGYLITPNVLSYVNGGYTGTYWSGSTLNSAPTPAPRRACTPTASTPRAGSSAAASRTA